MGQVEKVLVKHSTLTGTPEASPILKISLLLYVRAEGTLSRSRMILNRLRLKLQLRVVVATATRIFKGTAGRSFENRIERVRAKTFEELGKASLTVSVAWIVFGIIQPIFSERFSIQLAVIAFLGFLLFLAVGVILLERSSDDKG